MKELSFYKKPTFWFSFFINIALFWWLFSSTKKQQRDVDFLIEVLRSEESSIMDVQTQNKIPIRKFNGVLLWLKNKPDEHNSNDYWKPEYLENYTVIEASLNEIWVDVPQGSKSVMMKGYFLK